MDKSTPDRVVTTLDLGSIFGEVYLKAASQVTANSGFRKFDTAPFKRSTFSKFYFVAAQVTDQRDYTEKFPQQAANTAERVNNSQTSALESFISQLLLWLPRSAN
jgi:hypothetical protein